MYNYALFMPYIIAACRMKYVDPYVLSYRSQLITAMEGRGSV